MKICPTCKTEYEQGQFCRKDGAQLVDKDGQTGPQAPDDPLVGQVLADRFRILRRIGQGGMGSVYEALHLFLDRRVALKLLRPEITHNEEAVRRFLQEARAATKIGHENIVHIEDCGRLPDGQVYLTMEFIEGQPLSDMLAAAALPIPAVLDITIQVCHGLAAAHAKGIVHRDMKADNVFITGEKGRVKILDFGIAKMTDANQTNLTQTGAVFGTPNYMSPEQALGKQVGHRSDIYSVGVLLYEMLTGGVPFGSETFVAVLTQHVTEQPQPPTERAPHRGITPELEAIVLKSMCKDPDDRYEDMRAMVEALVAVRRQIVGSAPADSFLNVSRIQPPADPALTRDPSAGKVTATAGELVGVQTIPQQSRRSWLIPALVVAFVVAAGGGTALYLTLPGASSGGSGATAAGSAAGPGTTAAVTPPPTKPTEPAKKPANKPKADPEKGGSTPTKSAKVDIFVDSDPSGAKVLRGKKVLGKTPQALSFTRDEKIELTLVRRGYKDKTLAFTADGKTKVYSVRLTSKRRRRLGSKHGTHKKKKKKKRGGGTDEPLDPYAN